MALIEFGPLQVAVDEGVLQPRAWTLMQSQWAADLCQWLPGGALLEFCCGAGHIGQAAARLSDRALVQVDVDPHACSLAQGNAERNGLSGRVEVRCADVSTALGPDERFPLVLADPPYLPSTQVAAWPGDPILAIDGGDDGLDLLRRCIAAAAAGLAPGGAVLVQICGRGQIEALRKEIDSAGLRCTEVREVDLERAVALLVESS